MNSFYLCGIVLVAVAAVCFGELCTPDQWEGKEIANGGYVHFRRPGYILEHGVYSYDAINQRTAKTVYYTNNGRKFKFNVVIHYTNDTGKVYVADEAKDTCFVKSMSHKFKKMCIPDDAKMVDEYSLGLFVDGVNVTGYSVEAKDIHAYVAVQTYGDSIIPVLEQVRGYFGKTAFQENLQYVNIIPKIIDASVFDIPAQCKDEMEEGDITSYMLREQFILSF